MSIEKVKEYLAEWNFDKMVLEFDVSSATVELAAQALDCEPGMIAKTLSFLVGEDTVLILAAGDVKIDNAKYKGFFHQKAKMLQYDQVEDLVGHKVGGVCPFAVNEGVKVYLDESLKKYETVYPACGTASSAIPLTIPQLELCSGYIQWIDVTKQV